MSYRIVLAVALLVSEAACADSIRCGRSLVTSGDSVAKLLKVCGKPAMKYRSRDKDKRSGRTRSVQQWVYERGRRRAMVVSLLDGRVVRIQRD